MYIIAEVKNGSVYPCCSDRNQAIQYVSVDDALVSIQELLISAPSRVYYILRSIESISAKSIVTLNRTVLV